ncbi:MAG: hypothetical protein BWY32_02935 [bacterium ADurb.Bin243]|nr:MAG: hypothetical protein BWY32_02935 [bacterium ADurb.Bin243]HOD40926.1 hypothetical protein [Candidatus Wallbacteria bacterium]
MEKFIFLVIVFIVVTVIESLSAKKGDGTKSELDMDLSEFDFTKVKSVPKNIDPFTLNEIKPENSSEKQAFSEMDRSAENEKYFENKSVYIEQPLSQVSSYIDQPSEQADSYIDSAGPLTNSDDAYNVNTSGQIVKSKKDQLEKSKASVSFDVDSQYALNSLGQLVSSGAVVDQSAERIAIERRESRSRRKALKKMDSSVKSSMGELARVEQTGDDDKGNETLDIQNLFTGPNLKKSVLASIILDKSKFSSII